MGILQNLVNSAKNSTIGKVLTAASALKLNNTKNNLQNFFNNAKETTQNLADQTMNDATDVNTAAKELMEEQNQYNREAEERSFNNSRKYRQTAYQDTVKDMIKAGINPILAAQLGATGTGQFNTNSAVGYQEVTTKLDKKMGYLTEISNIIGNLASGRKTASSAYTQKEIINTLKDIKHILK